MPPLVDLTDQRFEMLVVKERVPNRYGQTMWLCGATKTLTQWSEITGISKNALGARLRRYGWSVEDALTIPINGRNDRARSSDGRFAPRN